MVTSQEPLTTREAQVPSQVSQESQDNHQHNSGTEAPAADAGSISIASSDNRKVSREDIELVQNLIERCLQLYMNKGEVVRTLSNRARIEPGFTTLGEVVRTLSNRAGIEPVFTTVVWQKLEEENADFFRAYYIRLKLKKQIILFNHLLEHQYHLMKYPVQPKVPLAPMQNGIHPLPVNNLPMGYPVMQPPLMPATGQPHLDSMGLPNCHVVNGIPAPSSFHPMHMNSGNEMENGSSEATPIVPPSSAMSTMSEIAVSPASAASSNHFPFASSDMPGIGMDVSAMDTTFASDVVTTGGLQLGPDGGIGSSKDPDRSLGHLWNFSFPDLTADLTDLGDLGALGEYDGSPFLPSDSDILLDSPEHDDMVEEFFADTITNGPASDDEKT